MVDDAVLEKKTPEIEVENPLNHFFWISQLD